MELMNEYGLLVAVATPVAVIGLINVLLALGGETGTLLLPTLRDYPAVLAQATEAPAAAAPAEVAEIRRPARSPITAGFDAADEMLARQAA